MNAEFIKKARKELGLSQVELAKKLGFSQNTISDWEKGKYEPKIIVIQAITLMLVEKRGNEDA